MRTAEELPAWLAACVGDAALATRCVVVAGGGGFADEVRALQAHWHFDDQLAHQLALDTMRLNARLLHALAPDLPLCTSIALGNLDAHGGLIWLPPPRFASPQLPASWSVTSDSVALWLAQTLGARAVLLVKSLPPAALLADSAANLAAQGVVDAHFPLLLAQGKVAARLLSKVGVGDFQRHLHAGTLPGVGVS